MRLLAHLVRADVRHFRWLLIGLDCSDGRGHARRRRPPVCRPGCPTARSDGRRGQPVLGRRGVADLCPHLPDRACASDGRNECVLADAASPSGRSAGSKTPAPDRVVDRSAHRGRRCLAGRLSCAAFNRRRCAAAKQLNSTRAGALARGWRSRHAQPGALRDLVRRRHSHSRCGDRHRYRDHDGERTRMELRPGTIVDEGPTGLVVFNVLFVIAAVLLLTVQYRTRLRRRSVAIGLAAVLAAQLIADYWPIPFLAPIRHLPAWAQDERQLTVVVEPGDIVTHTPPSVLRRPRPPVEPDPWPRAGSRTFRLDGRRDSAFARRRSGSLTVPSCTACRALKPTLVLSSGGHELPPSLAEGLLGVRVLRDQRATEREARATLFLVDQREVASRGIARGEYRAVIHLNLTNYVDRWCDPAPARRHPPERRLPHRDRSTGATRWAVGRAGARVTRQLDVGAAAVVSSTCITCATARVAKRSTSATSICSDGRHLGNVAERSRSARRILG